jgi:lipopolysaccharide/colanic/teichoic acid biosynthesis glycosyltransferase
MLKRTFDFLAATAALCVTWPLLLVLAVWIKLDSPGPVFYRGVRVGRGGKRFRIFKFRSMRMDAEKTGVASTSDDDWRITRSGRVIRKFKLDEISQMLNVVAGDMSLVGPRPEIPRYVELYDARERRLLSLRPGITDWASIWNSDEGAVLAGSLDPDKAYEELIRPTKLKLQLMYLENRRFTTDIKILIYTALKLVRRNWVPPELKPFGQLLQTRQA